MIEVTAAIDGVAGLPQSSAHVLRSSAIGSDEVESIIATGRLAQSAV